MKKVLKYFFRSENIATFVNKNYTDNENNKRL